MSPREIPVVSGLVLGAIFSMSLFWSFLASIPFPYGASVTPTNTLAITAVVGVVAALIWPSFIGAFALSTSLGALLTGLFAFAWGEPAWSAPMLALITLTVAFQVVAFQRMRGPLDHEDSTRVTTADAHGGRGLRAIDRAAARIPRYPRNRLGIGTARRVGALVALLGGSAALLAVTIKALVISYEYEVWLVQAVREPPEGFHGQLGATTLAFAAGPILLIHFGRLLYDDNPHKTRDWASSSGALMAIGAASGTWFIALGLRGPGTQAFVIEGIVLASLGVLAGALGLIGLSRSRRRLLLEAAAQNWSRPQHLFRRALMLGCFASFAVAAIVLGWRAHSPEGLDKTVLLAEILPPLILSLFLVPALVDSKSLQKWQLAGGAWFGGGLVLGAVYLFVGVIFLPNAASIGLFACYCLFVVAGNSILNHASDPVVAEELAGFNHPPRTIHHDHVKPPSGQLSLHLRNLHGIESLDMASGVEADLLHDQLHVAEETRGNLIEEAAHEQ